eukprot:CAMPEP_0173418720 /NCGR_PEP_ID=MMETSP1357-20121228/796_1 /TAXON_ID=77926 /ORGANISM="Hemiselmis rufescens, Strain PCC563" /LENGTH=67 /DNA_ID=CAMNT_0014381259 /DNA_START=25 /DNA_END=228 /DNA_ORIENTATION=-
MIQSLKQSHYNQFQDSCSAAGIFGCNNGRQTHAAHTSTSYVDINGFKVFGNGAVARPGDDQTKAQIF